MKQSKSYQSDDRKSDLEEILKTFRSSFITVGIYSFFINILMLAAPIYMLAVYDIVMPSKGLDTLVVVTLVILVFFIGGAVLEFVRSKVMIHISNRLDAKLNKRIFDATFDMAAKYPGKATPQPIRDFNTIKSFLTGAGAFAIFDMPWFPIYIAIMFAFSPIYGLYGLSATAIILIITIMNSKATKKGLEESNMLFQKSMSHFSDSIRNVEAIEAMGMRRPLYKRWMQKHYEYIKTHTEASSKAAAYTNASKSFRMISSSLMYGVGAILAITGQISPGMIIAGAVLLGRALAPISQIVGTWKQFTSARQAYHKLNELLKEFDEPQKRLSLPDPKGSITFEKVFVVPPMSKNPVLKGVNLAVEPGECVGFIGPSAAGKSTIAKAAVGVWPTATGTVRIDGAEISHYNKDELGKHIGYLPQDIELFEGTIAENICRFTEADPNDIVNAAKISGTHELILRLPDGYETKVGPGGATLSGGQKQRIGLARAVFKIPKIIVLDEPNSNLDDAGEYALMMAMQFLKQQGSTILFITHKRNLLALADKIAFVQDGTIKLYGARDEVLTALTQQQQQQQKIEKENKQNQNGTKQEDKK